MSKLVIVESPAKAKTIQKYLPGDYVVMASMGHIRDLPDNASQMPTKYRKESWASLGVNVEGEFEPVYIVKDPRSKKSIEELKKALSDADELILATDEDREGEAISWHLKEALKPKVPIKRMVFHEITKTAIQEALQNTRVIDEDLVSAQEARRILDRLVGYPLSLLVGKKIKYGLSAGRVQSAAVRLLVERERERRRFQKGTYWDLKAALSKGHEAFEAMLYAINQTRIATSKDFDEHTGKIEASKADKLILLSQMDATRYQEAIRQNPWHVLSVHYNPYKTSPKPPFTTSTLQQESSRKLGLSAQETMSIAQRLYENGHITYMRTDSVHLSDQAINAARNSIQRLYGGEYLPDTARFYKSSSKSAQEAHEAIRPTGDAFASPRDSGLVGRELALYELIWMRTVASQMVDARKTGIRADIEVRSGQDALQFRANGQRIDFAGFMRAYVEGSDDPEAELENKDVPLPDLKPDDLLSCQEVNALYHETKPPARFTEASLVKALEEEGIGRPSTYATIIEKIKADERYARKVGNALVPTYMAFAVTHFLEAYFGDLVDLKFTARMENQLDEIARGELSKVGYLHEFYRREGAFRDQIDDRDTNVDPEKARAVDLDAFEAELRVGRFGPYVQFEKDGEVKRVDVPDDIAPAELTLAHITELLEEREQGPTVIGIHPTVGRAIYLKKGPYGPYLEIEPEEEVAPPPVEEEEEDGKKKRGRKSGSKKVAKPKPQRASIPRWMSLGELTNEPEQGLALAIKLLSLPRKLGEHPEDSAVIEAGIGRYGAFIKHGDTYRNLPDESKILDITLEDALEILKEPKKGKGGVKSSRVLRELGEDKDGNAVQVCDGRYGPYIKGGKVNAPIPRGVTPEDLTLEKAVELLEVRKANMPEKPDKKAAKKKTTKAEDSKAKDSKVKAEKSTKKTTKAAAKTTKTAEKAEKSASSTKTAAKKTTKKSKD
ncbi:MAG: type I DNA topoisomerase [Myxococcales bacterium]|nr:type I DNA topoisomerase [Myxococcales bacterium]MCB9642951.1 type I DNA topoisomerase [Myxococcales bacterium]